ncbi:MAG: corrinoid protein [Ardenticatenaceae bacterium]|nr:corrinoid protein [Ardenticatenaceae bacterium]HBY96485.1 cobalamin-binding protein [Chloroflexota bacterium]
MATSEQEQEIVEQLKNGVIEFDEDAVVAAANEALESGMDAYKAVMDGLAAGMDVVGGYFASGEYFVPEVLMCADALYAGLNILKPQIKLDPTQQVKGSVVIGTVEGDVHDIGKNLVKMMFEVAGFTVYDLGRDVPLEQFVDTYLNTDSDIICMSAMMTTTMIGMPVVIEKVRAKNPNAKIMIGGAPINEDVARKWGADATSKDAPNALQEALNMMGVLRALGDQFHSGRVQKEWGADGLMEPK